MSVLIHTFSQEIDNVPQDVRELVQLISRPLPASLARVEPSTLSSIAQKQLKSVSLQKCPVDGERQDREPLQDVLNLVLITSAAMADCAGIALDGGERRRTDMFMFLLLRALARVCHEECSVSDSVPFIWPKGFDADHGVASMLISLVADESTLRLQEAQESHLDLSSPDATQSAATDDAVKQDDDESEVSPRAGDDDEVLSQPASEDIDTGGERSEDSGSEDDTSEESFQWFADTDGQLYNPEHLQQIRDRLAGRLPQEEKPLLDLPLYTQILTGQRVWPNVYFPVVCVADSINIVAHIASVAYQRRVWGIELPVVGLEVSPIGSGVRVHVGWLDPPSNDGRLPVVHNIKPAGNVSGLTAQAAAAQGVFDLANPHSALLFSQFFLALRPQISGLWDSISTQRLCRLEWRSDYNNATWTADIEEWAKHIDKSDASSTTDSSDEVYPLTPESSFIEHQMAPKQDQSTLKSGNLPTDRKPKTGPKSAKASSKASSAVSSTDSKTNAWSCSAFAKLKAETSIRVSNPSIVSWLLHRSAILETKYVFNGDKGRPLDKGQSKFEEMCEVYDDLTSFRWVKEWTALGELPSADPSLETLRRELYHQYSQVSEEPWAKVYADEKHAKIIGNKLSVLLSCASGAFTRSTGPAKPLEAEGRHDWDAMLSSFYVGEEDEVHSYNVLLERGLRMPRNFLLDALNDQKTELRDSLNTRLMAWADRNRAVYNQELKTRVEHAAFFVQCSTTLAASDKLSLEYSQLSREPVELCDLVKTQAKLEPARGTCDALLFSSLPLNAASPNIREACKAFRIVITTPPAADVRASQKNPAYTRSNEYLQPLDSPSKNLDTEDMRASQSLPKSPESRTRIDHTDIVLPRLVAEYKRLADTETKALNQARMYLVASVAFYSAVGIKEYPVFGLAVHGRIGNVIMAWMANDGTTHILERNIRKFDLGNPLQAFVFAIFLLRLKDLEEDLKKRFETCREKLAADLANGTHKDWAMPEKDKSQNTETASNAAALPRVDEEADEALAGRLGNLRLDAANPPAMPAVGEKPRKN